jgi:hypothetical protein
MKTKEKKNKKRENTWIQLSPHSKGRRGTGREHSDKTHA